jgi:hypothetical protein
MIGQQSIVYHTIAAAHINQVVLSEQLRGALTGRSAIAFYNSQKLKVA